MQKTVLHNPNPELRIKAEPVDANKITTPEYQKLIQDMKETMVKEHGVGLAATQIGYHERFFVAETKQGVEAFINPVIKKFSKKKVDSEEGCLSVPGVFGIVERSRQIVAEAYNEHGELKTIKTGGLLSIIIQHETDHLDGILFIDKAKSIHNAEGHEPDIS
jgi:peptide deformylase